MIYTIFHISNAIRFVCVCVLGCMYGGRENEECCNKSVELVLVGEKYVVKSRLRKKTKSSSAFSFNWRRKNV